MIIARHFISLVTLLIFSTGIRSQDSGFVYRDTSIVAVEVEATNDEVIEEEEEGTFFIPDTALLQNSLSIAPDSIRALKNLKVFAYAKNLDSLLKEYQKKQAAKQASSKTSVSWLDQFFMSSLTKYFFWLLAVVFIGFILSKLFLAEGFFQRSYTRTPVRVLEDEADNLSHSADYSKLINQAVTEKNYRLATRYYYLQLLQKLATKGIIEFSPDKTNYEYIQELAGKSYKNDFASLTRNYEYAWYGEFEINESVFEYIQQQFRKFNSVPY